jgi:hypothetical protein
MLNEMGEEKIEALYKNPILLKMLEINRGYTLFLVYPLGAFV